MARLAPIQSQVPRAPFLTVGSRLPGTAYADLVALFEAHDLIKASTLRGTVFTSDRTQFGWSQRIAREGRAEFLAAQTKVEVVEVRQLLAAVEDLAADWQPWDDLLDQARSLMAAGPPELAEPDRPGAVPALGTGRAAASTPGRRLAQAHRRAAPLCSDGAARPGRESSSTKR